MPKTIEPNLHIVWGEEQQREGGKRFYPIVIGLFTPRTLRNRFKYWFLCQFFPFKIIKWNKIKK